MASYFHFSKNHIEFLLELIKTKPVTPSRNFYEEEMLEELKKTFETALEKEKNG